MKTAIADPIDRCEQIKQELTDWGLYGEMEEAPGEVWRISPEPFPLSRKDVEYLENLGFHLLTFYQGLNQLYFDSIKGRAPVWISEYLDAGKPSDLLTLSRMKRFKTHLPRIIRPDIMVTESGYSITELDSVPGGFGRTSGLMSLYGEQHELVGQKEGGIPRLFWEMMEALSGKENCRVALVVSDEAKDYRSEMEYLCGILQEQGAQITVCHPKEILFQETGLYIDNGKGPQELDAVYRFFELFDLLNIPKAELISYSVKKGKVAVTPPYKPQLEEKLSFGLFHHPSLADWWEKYLGGETFSLLSHLIPRTWILDNRPLPPQAVIPGLKIQGRAVSDWSELLPLTQKERELVVKTSGFSPLSWGSRGVVVGHDVSSEDWQATLHERLDRFPNEPSILQEFHKGKRFVISYLDEGRQVLREMQSRVRLTPYYFVVKGKTRLGGVLATLCPQDKKKIHGMTDAVMVPCCIAD